MAKKIILEDSQGNKLYPKTLGECVTTESGETVEGLVSKSQMFSPTIETDSAMSKVGVGSGIDVHDNVKDGAYEECVFEGRTLVNLGLSKKIQITYNGNFVKEQLLKPNTTYTISYEIVAVSDNVTITNVPMFTQPVLPHTIGFHKMKRTTIEEISDTLFKIWGESDTLRTITIKNLTIIEGDYTNTDIPYFEGMCDVKMPILRNIGKNLCNIEEYNNFEIYSQTVTKDGDSLILETLNENAWRYVTVSKVFLEAGKQYTISCNCEVLNATEQNLRGILVLWSIDHVNNISGDATNSNNFTRTFTATESQEAYVKIYSSNGTGGIGNKIKYSNIQVEESPSKTPYEDYKTNILRTSEEIVLRSVGDIKDSYNALTGEYTKRIGEITFNGSENEWEDWNENSFVLRGSYFSDAIEHSSSTAPRLKCNNMVAGLGETPRTVRYYKTPTVLWTMVGKNDGETLDQFKQWLSQNPATIQYILAEPVTTIVKPSTTTPFAYQNGHVIVESGHEGQSLFPHLKYSVVTGRTGQVTQNTKVLRKQEQQIIGLEELLLTQIVQMEYERTLLQFDYELQMMMLG